VIVVKHKYIPGRGRGKVAAIGKALAHIKYIRHRPGPDREQGGREMFNERDNIDPAEMREAIRELGDSRVVVHKLTLAPEINPEDKKAFTREVMENLGRDMGRDLNWFAVVHNNTEHHHIHVVVLGKDRNGTEVRIDLKDIDRAKAYGDRYLERCHPLEMERSRREREDRERERRAVRTKERELAREERIREGLELPWLHQKLVREQLEPFKQWEEKQQGREKERESKGREPERPYHQDTIEAAGKEWSKADNLKDLRDLNEYLWDHYDERLPKDEYKKLVGWIREKERLEQETRGQGKPDKEKTRRDEFDWQGEKYSKKDSYEKLTGLAEKLRDSDERLPFNDYQKLRGWIEYKDRERFSGALEAELQRTHKKFERSKTMEDLKAAEGGRVIDPLQEQLMRNPIVGLFMTEAAIASEIVRSIPLDDRNRDYAKEQIDGLEDAKKNLDEREKERRDKALEKVRMPWEIKSQEERDREAREKIERAKEEAERKREEEKKKRKRDKERKRDDWDRYDPWGRF
jgi:hypothetical protein